ncbi:MAG: hypothetical protein KBC48_01635 [Candidatus Pacebacteria bacterium]|nr:hypothetical protein [Candidatus Paceibacterota bacterium]
MNINVIAEIDIYHGKLGIIGQDAFSQSVTFIMTGIRYPFDVDKVARKSMWLPVHEGAVVFECSLGEPLRNPRRLLKSIRSKILRAIIREDMLFQQEMADLDHEVSKALHGPY